MNSRVMWLLAFFLLAAGGFAAYFGYQTTQEARLQAEEARREVEQVKAAHEEASTSRVTIVVARRAIPEFQPLTADDLDVEQVKIMPPNAFSRIEDVVGLTAQTAIAAGQWLDRLYFQPGGDISRLLRPGERAIAIPIDEVSSGGGFLQPGDSVDVLMFAPGDASGASAQVVMRALRIVGMGTQRVVVQPTGQTDATAVTAGQPGNAGNDSNKVSGSPGLSKEALRQARTAVLAVAEKDVTRLLLASNIGVLRLAIRPPADQDSADLVMAGSGPTTPATSRLVRANALTAGSRPVARPPAAMRAIARPPLKEAANAATPASTITIYRGLNNVTQ